MPNVSEGSSDVVSPFGGLPFSNATRFNNQYSRPLALGFGMGNGPRFERFQENLANAQGPLADFIRQGQAFLPTFQQGMQQVGQQVSQQGQQAFGGLQASIDQFMQQLPNYQGYVNQGAGGAQQALGRAQEMTDQAFSPIQDQALYQQASRNTLDAVRQGSAARGLLDQGAGQQAETDVLTNLALDFAQRGQANQLAATQNLANIGGQLGQLGGMGAQLAAMGPQAQQMLYDAIPQLAQMLGAQYQMPFDALSQVGGFLASQQNPTLALLQATAPVLGSSQKQYF
jgi:hypothetical protein